jgi:hypothetical protein
MLAVALGDGWADGTMSLPARQGVIRGHGASPAPAAHVRRRARRRLGEPERALSSSAPARRDRADGTRRG